MPRDMRWWGWGSANDPRARPLPEHAVAMLRHEVGLPGERRAPVALADVRLRDSALAATVRDRLGTIVGDGGVRDDREARVVHAAGKGYVDLVRLRAGDAEDAPDAVVWPRSHDEVRAVLELCAAEEVAVVPFGGGTSVVGGVEPARERFSSLVALDLGRMDRLVALDERSLTAQFEPGIRAPEADRLLAARGLTLSHVPQSYEHVSLGGAVATRSAGQASTGIGRIDELVVGLRAVAPAGDVELPARPRSAAGPDLRELLIGSEGILGVITSISLRIRPVAPFRYEGWFAPSFHDGVEALRAMEQRECAPAVARLSDEEETRVSLALAGEAGLTRRIGGAYLRLRGVAGGCLLIAGFRGDPADSALRRAHAASILRAHGAVALGQSPGRAWERERFTGPYLRDELLAHGALVETLETATQWSDVTRLHTAVRDALRSSLTERGTPPLVWCHVSHLYPTGASLYFTFLARQQPGAEADQWRAAKTAASEAIVAGGGTITHHHAVGRDHRAYMAAEVGDTGLALLRAAKARLDPAGILNPGKLLPD